jgi:uncharacterized protein (TIGR01244 family)
MSYRQIDSTYFVAGQITPNAIAGLAEAGFATVVCMRPDGEGFGQPAFREIETACKAAGLKAHYLPMSPGSMPMDHASKLKKILREANGKVLGYCASGNRATVLYNLAGQASA